MTAVCALCTRWQYPDHTTKAELLYAKSMVCSLRQFQARQRCSHRRLNPMAWHARLVCTEQRMICAMARISLFARSGEPLSVHPIFPPMTVRSQSPALSFPLRTPEPPHVNQALQLRALWAHPLPLPTRDLVSIDAALCPSFRGAS